MTEDSNKRNGFIKAIGGQRAITLISILVIAVALIGIVAYNSAHKQQAQEQALSGEQEESTAPAAEKEPEAATQTAAAENRSGQPLPALPENSTEEEKAMADLNSIKIDDAAASQQKGKITADGSSMVGSITQLVADRYRDFYKAVQVNVGVAGTDEGIADFAAGKLDICGTTRKLTPEEAAKFSRISYREIKLAYDAVAVVTNQGNSWVKDMSVTDLRKVWDSKGRARLWSDVNSGWPGEAFKPISSREAALAQNFFCTALFSNGAAKLTKFNKEVDDNKAFIDSMTGEGNSIGFCNYTLFESNKDKLKAVGIVSDKGSVMPSFETIESGAYTPLSRTLYLYINNGSLEKDYVKAFVKVYMENAAKFVKASGYLPCKDSEYSGYIGSLN